MPYVEYPARELENSIIAGQANSAVTEYTFGSYDGDREIATATSGLAGIIVETAADNAQTSLKMGGFFRLKVNGNSVNIAALDPLKPTTGGLGVDADTDKDAFSAIAMEAATTDATYICVYIDHGYAGV